MKIFEVKNMDNRNTIAQKIQYYRKLQNITQDELSKQSGIGLSTIKKYETGNRNPKPDQLQKIAEALGISITVFLDYDIHTVSDVLSLIIKLDEQSPLRISSETDKDGHYLPDNIQISFDSPKINEALCSYLNYKQQLDLISHNAASPAIIDDSIADVKARLLLSSEKLN